MIVNAVLDCADYLKALDSEREIAIVLSRLQDEIQHHAVLLDDHDHTYSKRIKAALAELKSLYSPDVSVSRGRSEDASNKGEHDDKLTPEQIKLEMVLRQFEAKAIRDRIVTVEDVKAADVFLSWKEDSDDEYSSDNFLNEKTDSLLHMDLFRSIRDKRDIFDIVEFNSDKNPVRNGLDACVFEPFLRCAQELTLYDPYLASTWYKDNDTDHWMSYRLTIQTIISAWLRCQSVKHECFRIVTSGYKDRYDEATCKNVRVPIFGNPEFSDPPPYVEDFVRDLIGDEWLKRGIFKVEFIMNYDRGTQKHHDRFLWTKYGSLMVSSGFDLVKVSRDKKKRKTLGHAVLKYTPGRAQELESRYEIDPRFSYISKGGKHEG